MGGARTRHACLMYGNKSTPSWLDLTSLYGCVDAQCAVEIRRVGGREELTATGPSRARSANFFTRKCPTALLTETGLKPTRER
jgi:hypothetical protein